MQTTTDSVLLGKLRSTAKMLSLGLAASLAVPALFAGSVLAQTDTTDQICNNALMVFVNNMITFIGVIGPAIAFAVFAGSLVALSFYHDPEKQRKWKDRRNRSLIYGALLAVAGQVFSLFISMAGGSMASCVNLL